MPLHAGGCCVAIVALSGTGIGCCDGSCGSRGYSKKAIRVGKGCIYNVRAVVDRCAVTDRIAEDVVATGRGAADPTGCMLCVPPLRPLLCRVAWLDLQPMTKKNEGCEPKTYEWCKKEQVKCMDTHQMQAKRICNPLFWYCTSCADQ